ncbi:MAG: hypothetical protein JWO09_1185 [Bacteroidetes bacterium]|nr:hypothetical protein [Bacteroidota bacterium]
MASLKVFVSSTCYDLNIVRAQLRSFLINLGHEPVMSDYNDVLFDPRSHTHESCIQEIKNADVVILIIGSRFGGMATPKVITSLDLENLKNLSKGNKLIDTPDKMSITQLEILNAVESNIPIFTFIDSRVSYDHLFYEKNKNKGFLENLDFPSIEKKESAIYIFEFINFLRLRSKNNSITEFSKSGDIEDFLKKQWSSLLQRLLSEQKNKIVEEKRLDFLSKQIEDIKTAILTTIPSDELKETAKGAIKYRAIIDFLLSFKNIPTTEEIILSRLNWEELLLKFGIVRTVLTRDIKRKYTKRMVIAFIRADERFYLSRYDNEIIENYIKIGWMEFTQLPDQRKKAIYNAIKDNFIERDFIRDLEFIDRKFEDYEMDTKQEEKTE